jgi:3-oxoacyl-[acyl-carrier-protein] synthase-3
MIINLVTDYIPLIVIPNEYFFVNYGITNEDIISKCGIKQRCSTEPNENTNSMAIEAVKKALPDLPFPISEIDLIIGATYTPYIMIQAEHWLMPYKSNLKLTEQNVLQ